MRLKLIPLILLSFGAFSLITLSSVSPDLSQRQLVFWFISFFLFFIISRTPISFWWHWGDFLWKALVFILISLLIFGRVTRGASAWIDLGGGLKLQPSQFALLSFLLVALPKFSRFKMLKESEIAKLFLYILIPSILIFLQPDFGTAFLYTIAASTVVFWQKIPTKYWHFLLGSIVGLSIFGWLFILQPYQKLRVTSFFTGYQFEQNAASYNARQSLIAVGSGQIWGKGLGKGTQSQLRFLPERQTDFIFASLAEESGLVGSLIIISLYGILFMFLLIESNRMKENKFFLFTFSILVYLFVQVLINIGMNMGLLPITGVTLPFVSYGGSSLLSSVILLAIIQRILIENPNRKHLRIT
jgi:rod shape determining protein RodA